MLRFKATYWDEFMSESGDEHTVWGVCEGPSFAEATKRIEDAFGRELLSVEVMADDDCEDEVFIIDSDTEDWVKEALAHVQHR